MSNGEFPYVLNTWNSARKGHLCKMLPTPFRSEQVQIQFEDGVTAIVPRMNLTSAKRKKFYERVDRAPGNRSKLAAKPPPDQGDV